MPFAHHRLVSACNPFPPAILLATPPANCGRPRQVPKSLVTASLCQALCTTRLWFRRVLARCQATARLCREGATVTQGDLVSSSAQLWRPIHDIYVSKTMAAVCGERTPITCFSCTPARNASGPKSPNMLKVDANDATVLNCGMSFPPIKPA